MEASMDADLGLLVLRLALGPMLFAHGWNKIFGGGGLEGTAGWSESLGLRPGWLHARFAAFSELAVGTLVTVGLLTGLAATGLVALMIVATLTDHRGKGYFIFKGGCEYTVLVAMIAVALAALGPGSWSLDHALDWTLAGGTWAIIAALGGTLAALVHLATFRRPVKHTGAAAV